MLTLRPLTNVPLEQIVECFNHAFSHYMIPTELNLPQFLHKIKTDNIKLDLSIGGFDGDKLAGFILHGTDTIGGQWTAYNAGSGILAEYRGKRLPELLYNYNISLLKEAGIQRVQAEIITTNTASLRAAQRIGFQHQRKFVCMSGTLAAVPVSSPTTFQINSLRAFDWDLLATFWDWQPAWQNNHNSVERTSTIRGVGAYASNQLVGYVLYNAVTHRIVQIAVHPDHRRQGIAQSLLNTLSQKFVNIDFTVINFDDSDKATARLLAKFGLQPFLHQVDILLTL